MAVKELQLATLADLDGGKIAVAWQQALKRLIADCEDRPGEYAARELTLTLSITPVMDRAGMCEEVGIQGVVTAKAPKLKSKVYAMGVRRDQRLAFSDSQPNGRPGLFDQTASEEVVQDNDADD